MAADVRLADALTEPVPSTTVNAAEDVLADAADVAEPW